MKTWITYFLFLSNISHGQGLQDSSFFLKAPAEYHKEYYRRLFNSYEKQFGPLPTHFIKESDIQQIRVGHHIKNGMRVGSLIEIRLKTTASIPDGPKGFTAPNAIRIWQNKRVDLVWNKQNETLDKPFVLSNSQKYLGQEADAENLKPFSIFSRKSQIFTSNNNSFWVLEFDSLPPGILPLAIRSLLVWHEKEFYQSPTHMIRLDQDEYGLLF